MTALSVGSTLPAISRVAKVRKKRTVRVRVGTVNIGNSRLAKALEDLHKIADKGVTILIGNEFGDRLDLVERFLDERPGWRVLWLKDSNAGRKVCILFDSKVASRGPWASLVGWAGGFLGPRGAGEDRPPAKRLVRARFKLAPGIKLRVLGHHLVASAFSTSGAEGARRKDAFREQVESFFRVARRTKTPTVGGGDWNAERSNVLLKHLTPKEWRWDSVGPTRGTRTIDILGHMEHDLLKVTDASVIPLNSDHRCAWVEYELTNVR